MRSHSLVRPLSYSRIEISQCDTPILCCMLLFITKAAYSKCNTLEIVWSLQLVNAKLDAPL